MNFKIEWLGMYSIILGTICLFFPALIMFGYGAEGFDWFVVVFLSSICVLLILFGIFLINNPCKELGGAESEVKNE